MHQKIFAKVELMVRGLSQKPNLTEGPAATWDFRRSSKEEEEEEPFAARLVQVNRWR
jgi:hypothetical protein